MGTKWDRFLYWCGRFLRTPQFEEHERGYKIPVANRVVGAKDALLAGDAGWVDLMHHAIVDKPNNLTSWRQTQPMEAWFRADPETAALALRLLWNDTLPVRERLNEYARISIAHGVTAPISETSFLHLAMGIEEYPPFRAGAMDKAMELTSYASPRDAGIKSGDIGGRYMHFLRFLDTMVSRGSERGIAFRDRLDAQSAAWVVTQWYPLADWSDEDRQAFNAYQGSPIHRKETWPSLGN
jgi:hypothetical protein